MHPIHENKVYMCKDVFMLRHQQLAAEEDAEIEAILQKIHVATGGKFRKTDVERQVYLLSLYLQEIQCVRDRYKRFREDTIMARQG